MLCPAQDPVTPRKLAAKDVARWKTKLLQNGLVLGIADQQSLRFAFLLRHVSEYSHDASRAEYLTKALLNHHRTA